MRRLALRDNRAAGLAAWDADVLAAPPEDADPSRPWEPDDLTELLASEDAPREILADPDDVPDAPEEPLARPSDLWLLAERRLLCSDAPDPSATKRLMQGEQAASP